MSLTMPRYIEKANILDIPIDYSWEDPDQCDFDVPRLLNKIVNITSRGKFALTIGFAEWVHWRLSNHFTDPLCFQFLQAAWAGIIDRRYFNHLTSSHGDATTDKIKMAKSATNLLNLYKGDFDEDAYDVIKGPVIASIIVTAIVADYTVPGDAFVEKTIHGSNVAELVVGNLKAFKDWRRNIIKRLSMYNQIDDFDDSSTFYGSPIPREIIDPDFDYTPEAAPELINTFLSQLEYETNPFLPTPEELKEVGFEGTPYVYETK